LESSTWGACSAESGLEFSVSIELLSRKFRPPRSTSALIAQHSGSRSATLSVRATLRCGRQLSRATRSRLGGSRRTMIDGLWLVAAPVASRSGGRIKLFGLHLALTLNCGIFLTLIVSSLSLPSAIRMSCLWPTSKVGHWPTRWMVFPARWPACTRLVKAFPPLLLTVVKESEDLWLAPLLMVMMGVWVVGEVGPAWRPASDCDDRLPSSLLPVRPVFSHLDVSKRQTFSFRHQLQPQFVVKQSLHLFCPFEAERLVTAGWRHWAENRLARLLPTTHVVCS